MSRPLTLNVPDDVFDTLDLEARAAGVSIQDWAMDVLSSRLVRAPKSRNGSAEFGEGLARLLAACGTVAVGDPSGADNEAIDRDLAREYESTHEA